MLTSLKLTNFKKHENLEVNFTAGTNGIYGPNYKGKTTLLYAVLFALGGSAHVPGNRLARIGSDGRFKVELGFMIGTEHYTVVRTKSTANLLKGEEILAASASAVTDEIEKLIGMSVKQWKELHYAKQKNAHSLLRYSATNLHQLMRRLVGAEELDGVQNRLKMMANKEQGIVDALGEAEHSLEECQSRIDICADRAKSVAEVRSALADTIAAYADAEAQGRKAVDRARNRLTEIAEQRGAANTQKARFEAAQRGLENAKQTLAERQQKVAELQAELDAFEGFDSEAAENLVEQFTVLSANVKALRGQLQGDGGRAEAEELVEAAKSAVGTLQSKLAGLKAEFGSQEDLTAELEKALDRKAEAQARVKALKQAIDGATCPTCDRPFEDHDPKKLAEELEAAQAELKLATDAVTESTDRQGQLKAAAEQLKAAEAKATYAESNLATVIGNVEKAQEKVTAAEAKLAELGDVDTAELRERITAERRLAVQHGSAVKEVRFAEESLETAQNLVDRLGEQPTVDVAALDAEEEKLKARLSKDQGTLSELLKELSDARESSAVAQEKEAANAAQLALWTERLEKLREREKRHDVAAKRLAKIKHLQKYLKDNAESYMNKAWTSFMAHASQFANLCTGGDIEGLERTEDGAFSFTEAGEEMQLEEASGAQEAIIGLAVQLALASAAPCHLNVLLLDEPTADMDPDRSMATIAALSMLGQQIVFVSHHQTDNSVCSNSIHL